MRIQGGAMNQRRLYPAVKHSKMAHLQVTTRGHVTATPVGYRKPSHKTAATIISYHSPTSSTGLG